MTFWWWLPRRLAALGVTGQFLALARTLGEIFRLKYFAPERYTLATTESFAGAALFTAVLVAVAALAFALGRYRTALTIAVANIVTLLVYRVVFM